VQISISHAAGSSMGRDQKQNGDSGYAGPYLLAVADGLGGVDGYEGGAIASSTVINALRRFDAPAADTELPKILARAFPQANLALLQALSARPGIGRMGTSLTAMLWNGTDRFAIAHIGDSRAYLLRDGVLFQITADHTFAELQGDEPGENPRLSHLPPFKVLDGALERDPDVTLRESKVGDRYLLCSDGLTDLVGPREIFEVLSAERRRERAVAELIEIARAHGSSDNITCVVVDVREAEGSGALVRPPSVVGAAASAVRHEDLPAQRLAGRPHDALPGPGAPRQPPLHRPSQPALGLEPTDFAINGFEILEPLGRGGFATVYRATQLSLNRPVAVKVLHERLWGDVRRRFEREVGAILRLSGHPNVLTVYDRGELPDGRPYLIMEYCAGGSLRDRLDHGPLPVQEVLRIGVKAADALAVAHREGILHRDLKPDNLLATRFEPVALADFGIAKLVGPDGNVSMTAKAFTPAYAPPEQFDEDYRGPDEAGDIYSLGATLYALLAGAPPRHPGRPLQGPALIAHYVRAHDLPLPGIPGVSEPLMAVLRRALERRPAHRYRSADELLAALQRVRPWPF